MLARMTSVSPCLQAKVFVVTQKTLAVLLRVEAQSDSNRKKTSDENWERI